MKRVHVTAAVTALTIALVSTMLAGCSSNQPASPPPSSRSTSAATASPRPVPTQVTGSGTATPTQSSQVLSSRLTYPWHWPNDVAAPGRVTHTYAVPPVPELVQISVGRHPGAAGQRPYDRMSFAFTTAFPNYRFEFANSLVSDASGKVIPLNGSDVLKIVFTQAQAHVADGTRSTIISQPARDIGYPRITDFAQAGDFEGTLSYGIGITRPVSLSNPQFPVRAYEVEKVTATGQHQYVVAIDIDASNPA